MNFIFPLEFDIVYKGSNAESGEIELYDLARSLYGLHRSLALTTHFVINNEVITKAPSLRNALIYTYPSEESSFKQTLKIGVLATAAYALLSSPNASVVGHLMYSSYDYVVKSTLGFHINLSDPLYKSYLEHESLKNPIPISKLDSVAEKCEDAIVDIHRPIYASKSASYAILQPRNLAVENAKLFFDSDTYDSIRHSKITPDASLYSGRVSNFNANTKTGRIYTLQDQRPIPFSIDDDARVRMSIFSESLNIYTKLQDSKNTDDKAGFFQFNAKRVYSANDTTRRYVITETFNRSLIPLP